MKVINHDSAFSFACSHCGQSLAATAEIIGATLDCPSCEKSIVVPSPKDKRITNPSASTVRNLIATALATAVLTSAFWWTTPFIARAKGKQTAEGALSALQEGFGPSEKERREGDKLKSVAKNKILFQFDGNQRVTVTNNSDFEIEELDFTYTNDENLTVGRGHVYFGPLKSGQSATRDISTKETIKPGFKVHPECVKFSTIFDSVYFPD